MHLAKDSGVPLELAHNLSLDLPLACVTKEQYDTHDQPKASATLINPAFPSSRSKSPQTFRQSRLADSFLVFSIRLFELKDRMLAARAASILGLPKLSPSANETLKQDGQALVELRRTINAPCENVHVANYGQHFESRHLRAMRISSKSAEYWGRVTQSAARLSPSSSIPDHVRFALPSLLTAWAASTTRPTRAASIEPCSPYKIDTRGNSLRKVRNICWGRSPVGRSENPGLGAARTSAERPDSCRGDEIGIAARESLRSHRHPCRAARGAFSPAIWAQITLGRYRPTIHHQPRRVEIDCYYFEDVF